MSARARAWSGAVVARLRGAAVWAHVAEYDAALSPPPLESWTREWQSGHWEYLEGIDQAARYSVLAGYAELVDHRSILDLGCGAGVLRQRVGHLDFERFVGVDPVAEAIEQARPLADERTEFRVGDAFLSDLGQFDIVVSNEVLYTLPDPARELDRMRELIRPGGHLLTSNLRHPGDVGLYRLLDQRLRQVDAVDLADRTARGRKRRRVAIYRRDQ